MSNMNCSNRGDEDDFGKGDTVINASPTRLCWLPCCFLHCGFLPYSTVLTLSKDSVTRQDVALCGERTSLRPYSELGRVETGYCCCFVCVDSNLGTIMPSFGCDRELVNNIVAELQERSKAHVDDRRKNLQDEVLQKAASIHEKTELLNQHLKNAEKAQVSPASLSMDDR